MSPRPRYSTSTPGRGPSGAVTRSGEPRWVGSSHAPSESSAMLGTKLCSSPMPSATAWASTRPHEARTAARSAKETASAGREGRGSPIPRSLSASPRSRALLNERGAPQAGRPHPRCQREQISASAAPAWGPVAPAWRRGSAFRPARRVGRACCWAGWAWRVASRSSMSSSIGVPIVGFARTARPATGRATNAPHAFVQLAARR
jgi:hypothetical protein